MKKRIGINVLLLSLVTCTFFISFQNVSQVSANSTSYEEINANVESIQTYLKDNAYAFSFFIPKSDYGTKSQLTLNKNTWKYGDDLNFLDKIVFEYKTSTTFNNERFINVWNRNGAFTLRTTSTAASSYNFVTDIDTITILAGCTFPSYDYCVTSVSPICYKTTRDMVFVNDGSGNFTYDKHYGDYTLPSGYTCIDTEINTVNEKNGLEKLSFLQFGLTASDYGTSFINLGKTYATKLAELKFLDYIYINGVPASSESKNTYALESLLNYGTAGSFAIRTYGNNTGAYYKSSGKIINESTDYCAYEVTVAKGCCFPSYAYLTGSTLNPTCYVNTTTKRFVWDKGAYVLASDYNEPNRIDNNVTSVSSHGSGVDTAIDFYMESFDYPNTAGDCILNSSFNLTYKVIILDTNDTTISFSSQRFANVWNKKGCFSIRKPSGYDWTTIKSVTIYKGCEFQPYSSYTNFDDARYVTTETRRFYSNGDGTFYLCNEVTADEFATNFSATLVPICSETEQSQREGQLNIAFTSYAGIYSKMSVEEKAKLVDSGSSTVKNMLAKYDYILSKYNITDDFLNRKSKYATIQTINNSDNVIATLIAALASGVCISFMFVIIKNKNKRKESE